MTPIDLIAWFLAVAAGIVVIAFAWGILMAVALAIEKHKRDSDG